ncbi:MAG: S1 RNA-binding domain-containing protein [Lachnospiraceae bacterium]|nr:S1 RNA-binding domain-containing protein [Lachnospiraceae bacterium]
MRVGTIQNLIISRRTDFGLYLKESSDSEQEVLLPKNQVPDGANIGDELRVFLYRDSKDRLIATLKTPRLTIGTIARCKVIEVGKIGAFLDWGLEKDLLLPYREMTGELQAGMEIPVALYADKSDRLCATMKLYKYLDTASDIKKGDNVSGTVYEISDNFGVFVAVEDKYQGLIPKREMPNGIHVGDQINARVSAVKSDGKIDLSLKELTHIQMDIDADKLIKLMKSNGGSLDFNDKTSPEVIKKATDMSKNEFKRAVGRLLKNGLIEIKSDSIVLKSER